MRKVIYAFCVVAFASIFILSCSGNEFYDANSKENLESAISGNQKLNIPEQYKTIGEKHNEGLESAFAALRSHYKQAKTRASRNDTLRRLSKDECLSIAQQGLKEFCTDNIKNYSEISEQVPSKMGAVQGAIGGGIVGGSSGAGVGAIPGAIMGGVGTSCHFNRHGC